MGRVWDLLTKRVIKILGPLDSVVRCIAFAHDGSALACGTGFGYRKLWVWDTATWKGHVGYTEITATRDGTNPIIKQLEFAPTVEHWQSVSARASSC